MEDQMATPRTTDRTHHRAIVRLRRRATLLLRQSGKEDDAELKRALVMDAADMQALATMLNQDRGATDTRARARKYAANRMDDGRRDGIPVDVRHYLFGGGGAT
jgi:hypothetical protein